MAPIIPTSFDPAADQANRSAWRQLRSELEAGRRLRGVAELEIPTWASGC